MGSTHLEDGIPAHLQKTITATLRGRRNIKKPPPPRLGGSLIDVGDGAEASQEACLDLASEGAALGAPQVYNVARITGLDWKKQQEQQWWQEQAATFDERVAAECKRLLSTMVGPQGLDPARWPRFPDRLQLLAKHNVKRQIALERERLQLNEWDPRLVMVSASSAVRSRVQAASSAGSSSSEQQGRAASAKSRYMQTDLARNRILKELKRVASRGRHSRHAGGSDSGASSGSGSGSGPPSATAMGSDGEEGGRWSDAGSGSGAGASGAGPQQRSTTGTRQKLEDTRALASKMAAYLEVHSSAASRLTKITTGAAKQAVGQSQSRALSRVVEVMAGDSGRAQQAQVAGRMAQWAASGKQVVQARQGLTQEETEGAGRLVALYRSSCTEHHLHVDEGVVAALEASMRAHPHSAPVPTATGAGAGAGPEAGAGAGGAGAHGLGFSSRLPVHVLHLVALTLISPQAAAALAEVLLRCAHVAVIVMERCVLSAGAWDVVLPALWSLRLKALITTNTDFPQASWPMLQRALGRPSVWGCAAYWWDALRSLQLSGNSLGDQGLCALLEVLPDMPALATLALRQAGLTDLSAAQLQRLLARCVALRDLDIGYNNLGPHAAAALAAGLPDARCLERLCCAWNSMGGGLHHLGWALLRLGKAHCALRHLDLAGTDLVAQDMMALAAVLRAVPHTPLQHLVLSCNSITGVAGQCLMRNVQRLMPPPPPPHQLQRGASATGTHARPILRSASRTAAATPPSGASRLLSSRPATAAPGGRSSPSLGPCEPLSRTHSISPIKRITIKPHPVARDEPQPQPHAEASAASLAPYGVTIVTIDCQLVPGNPAVAAHRQQRLQRYNSSCRRSQRSMDPGTTTTATAHAHAQPAAAVPPLPTTSATTGLPQPHPDASTLGPHAYQSFSLDLSRAHPDRTVAQLLMEHEVHMRGVGHRSALHSLKWCGKVYRRDGVEVAALDVVYEGWTHSLPFEGLLELVVAVVPPHACPWLTNRRLHCNAALQLERSSLGDGQEEEDEDDG